MAAAPIKPYFKNLPKLRFVSTPVCLSNRYCITVFLAIKFSGVQIFFSATQIFFVSKTTRRFPLQLISIRRSSFIIQNTWAKKDTDLPKIASRIASKPEKPCLIAVQTYDMIFMYSFAPSRDRKQPDTLVFTLIFRIPLSAWLLSKGTSKSYANKQTNNHEQVYHRYVGWCPSLP